MTAHAIFPVMGNRLKDLRKDRGWTLEEAADAIGVSRSQYIKLERGERRLTADYIAQAAQAFGVQPGDVIAASNTIPVMGYVGAGAEVEPDFEQVPPEGLDQIEVPFALPDDMIALQVRGDSMLPMFEDGMILVVWREQRKSTEDFYGKRAVVRTDDGRRFVKTIIRGASGTISLLSSNAPPIENVVPVWIGEIFTIFPADSLRQAVRRVHRQGGIQGQLALKSTG